MQTKVETVYFELWYESELSSSIGKRFESSVNAKSIVTSYNRFSLGPFSDNKENSINETRKCSLLDKPCMGAADIT